MAKWIRRGPPEPETQVQILPGVPRSSLTLLGGSALWVIPLALIYIYAVVDAVVFAGKSGTPDKTGLV